jgi:hypothetical protein
VVDSRTVDISYLGSSISYPIFNSLQIMPQHIWQTTSDSTYHPATSFGPAIGIPDTAKLDQSYDPIASGTFIGSGPFACISGTLANPGTIGKGCAPSQQLNPGDSLILTAYDFSRSIINGNAVSDPFYQYMRSFDSSWGSHGFVTCVTQTGAIVIVPNPPGCGVLQTQTGVDVAASLSGQFQEFSWADKNHDGQVTISEVQQVESCAGQVGTGVCATAFITGLHVSTETTVTIEPAIAASHLDDALVLPLALNSLSSGTLATNISTYPSITVSTAGCAPGVACTVTVSITDTTPSPTTPTGTVKFGSAPAGTFGGGVFTCNLAGAGATTSCSVTYTPAAGSTLTATYQGNKGFIQSSVKF